MLLPILIWWSLSLGQSPASALPPRIELSAFVEMPEVMLPAVVKRVDVSSLPAVFYVYSSASLCSPRAITTEKPETAGNGWRVELRPEADAPPNSIKLTVIWQRLWEGGIDRVGGRNGKTVALMQVPSGMAVDTIDADMKRIAEERAEPLKNWKAGQPIPPDVANDQFVQYLQKALSEKQLQKAALIRQNGYRDDHPALADINNDIANVMRPLNSRVQTLIDDHLQKLRAQPPTNVDGCAAQGMTLQISATTGAIVK